MGWQREAAFKIYNDSLCRGKNAKEGIDRIEQIIKDEARKSRKVKQTEWSDISEIHDDA